MEVILSQAEADKLITMEKQRVNEERWSYPMHGSISIPLASLDRRENFLLDIERGRIDLLKGKYQNRARQTAVLVRLDFGGPPHRNPDGTEIGCPHLHLYREGYGDKWAVMVPEGSFSDPADLRVTLDDFMRYCNVTLLPFIDLSLFT
jgi:hypothetical protein